MVADMINDVLSAEAEGRSLEAQAKKQGEKIISDAKIQADIIMRTTIEQAEKQANAILSEAEISSVGIVRQAEKLAELREKKSINESGKLYDEAIDMIFDLLLK